MSEPVPNVTITRVTGAFMEPFLESLARLRIEVFREFPYLYQGNMDFEQRYMREFAGSKHSTLVLARHADDGRVLGAATASPLLDHGDVEALAAPLVRAGIELSRVFYFGESVLTKSARGRGIGHAFFDQREARARELGYPIAAFCAVVRPLDHPLRPCDYVPHDAFWTRRGYLQRADLITRFSWRDVGQPEQSEKPMMFWLKEL